MGASGLRLDPCAQSGQDVTLCARVMGVIHVRLRGMKVVESPTMGESLDMQQLARLHHLGSERLARVDGAATATIGHSRFAVARCS